MTVPTEAAYLEMLWTGVETSFTPGFTAERTADVVVSALDADGLPVPLTLNAHYTVALDSALNVTVQPIVPAMPVATALDPVTLVFERDTDAVQGTDFAQLNRFNSSVHQTLFDRAFRILGELKSRVVRSVGPFFVTDETVDFRPRRVTAADPVNDQDLATKIYVLTVTGILNLEAYVAACAASAVAAAASAAAALLSMTGAQTARDKAQAWSDTPENTPVQGAEYSAFHWSQKAAASSALVLAALAVTDYGFVTDAPTSTRDYGTIP